MKNRLWIVSALMFLLAVGLSSVALAEVKIKIGHGVPENNSMHLGFLKFKELIEAKSNGEFVVDIFPNQQLGGDRELTEALMMNNVTLTAVSGNNLAPFAKEYFVTDLFFIAPDQAKARAIYDSEAGKKLLSSLEPLGIKGLGNMENGFRNLTNSKREVKTPEDLSGIKMRVPENPVQIAAWKSLGASPTPMAWSELFTALQQGTLDGQESTIESIYTMHFNEVQKFMSITRHHYTPYTVIASKDFYDGLTEAQRAVFDEAISEAIAYQREEAQRLETEYLEKIMQKGNLNVTVLTAEELAAFRGKLGDVNEMVKERCGAEIFDAFMAEINKH